MKIGFYSPYLDSFGGGERYLLTLASHWSKKHDVLVFWDDNFVTDKAQKRLDIDLSRIKVVQNIFRERNVFKKLLITRQYDLIFFLSDGSIPSTLARRNVLHFQVPFPVIPYSAAKLSRYQRVVCNSQFTKQALDNRVGERAVVIYPPVAPIDGHSTKGKIILSVGRFSGFHTAKKQHVLIDAFKQACEQKQFAGWKLVLAGGLLPSDQEYFDNLKDRSGLPIILEANISRVRLHSYYRRASVYWHAAGFGETDPRWMEHFGISTVEAMSAGAVPIVFAGGGQPEIVKDRKNGFLWHTVSELLKKTNTVVASASVSRSMRECAVETSKQFSVSRFCEAFDKLLYEIS